MRTLVWLGTLTLCFVSGGASCARRDPPMVFTPPPVVFQATPSVDELAAAVNRTDAVRELSSNSASVEVLTMSLPKLRATLNLRRDRDFRMRANLPVVMGAGLDLGSNHDVFWFEVPEGMSKTLYYARHDEYRQNLHRAILPVDPTWIMEALGLVHIDPGTVVAGPVARPDGKLEIRTTSMLPDGMYQRVCFIEPSAAYVTNQFLYEPGGKLIATSVASNHEYHPDVQCVLPRTVELHLSPTMGPPLGMKLEIGSYAVNQLLSNDPQLFVMPQTASEAVNLAAMPGVTGPLGLNHSSAYDLPRASEAMGYSASRIPTLPMRGTTR